MDAESRTIRAYPRIKTALVFPLDNASLLLFSMAGSSTPEFIPGIHRCKCTINSGVELPAPNLFSYSPGSLNIQSVNIAPYVKLHTICESYPRWIPETGSRIKILHVRQLWRISGCSIEACLIPASAAIGCRDIFSNPNCVFLRPRYRPRPR